tara:strand:+ start:1715 stop:3289 length:1575 start_codon:yes stop_codon:yes gene_type:complete
MRGKPSKSAIKLFRVFLGREDFGAAASLLRSYPKTDEVMDLERELYKAAKDKAIIPQRGPQERLMTSRADFIIYGGGAGGGKTHGTIMLPSQYFETGEFKCAFFRKSNKETRLPGGLWDEAKALWEPVFKGKARENMLDVVFPSGSRVSFEQLFKEGRSAAEGFKGMQAPLQIWDEASGFQEDSVFYVATRVRGSENFKKQVVLTVNPDRDNWTFKLVRPWVDPDFPVSPGPDGLCYFIRCEDKESVPPTVRLDDIIHQDQNILWVKSTTEGAQSLEYIHATVEDNLFIGKDYIARINAADRISRIRLLGGPESWFIRHTSGEMFDRSWFKIVRRGDHPKVIRWVRSWDFAGRKEQRKGKQPDFNASGWVGITACNSFVIDDVTNLRLTPAETEDLVKEKWQRDRAIEDHEVLFQVGGGDAGFHVAHTYRRHVIPDARLVELKLTGDKITRAEPFSAAAEQGRVYVIDGPWNQAFLDQCQDFPAVAYDDMVDAVSAGVLYLSQAGSDARAVSRPRKQSFNVDQW